MNYLIILNSLAIALMIYKLKPIKFSIRRDTTSYNGTLIGYDVSIEQLYFRIPIRNQQKTELKEEISRMMSPNGQQGNLQQLTAKFSWLRTWEEVRQFERDYSVVNKEIVDRLVSNFTPK